MEDIDDDTLRFELESRGQSVGPIVDSTRNLYLKLLKRLIDEEVDNLINGQLNDDIMSGDNNSSPQTSAKRLLEDITIESKQSPKSKFLVFILTLILCIVFTYFVKKG